MLRHLWHAGPASRSELAARMALRPNTVGELVADLVTARVLKEGEPDTRRVGRPRIPLTIDPDGRHVLGVAMAPGRSTARILDLLGRPQGEAFEITLPLGGAIDPVGETRSLIEPLLGPHVLAVGLTVTGFIDETSHDILFSSVLPLSRSISLEPLWRAAGDASVRIGNDMHAVAARWMMDQGEPEEDVILVQFGDTSLGAAHLVGGRLSRGSIYSANELGHSRFPAQTHVCYCGRTGCLEQICGSDYLAHLDGTDEADLGARIGAYVEPGVDPSLDRILELLALGIGNVINFCRPHRLVLTSPLAGPGPFTEELRRRVGDELLPVLRDRVRREIWASPTGDQAETAAWLALTGLYCDGWT